MGEWVMAHQYDDHAASGGPEPRRDGIPGAWCCCCIIDVLVSENL